jgi:predicted amidophosphoribosyltransferase
MEIVRHWRLKAQRYRLEGSICPSCGKPMFPPRPVCPHCASQLWRITDAGIPVLPASINTSDIETCIRHEILERMIG